MSSVPSIHRASKEKGNIRGILDYMINLISVIDNNLGGIKV